MTSLLEGRFMPQPGDKIENLKAVNARIADENRKEGVHEISQETVDEISAMDDEQFELFIKWAVDERDKRRKKASN